MSTKLDNDLYVFPAYAGVSPIPTTLEMSQIRLPRLRGGEPDTEAAELLAGLSSPPTRG
ncbi:Uncharacterised protein [Cutibacterium granulosum]|uniref:Uncharacterized protein n=1 Tax=Cutibacterium granulosum TaxID=33011 RepID=A0A239WJL9_9ACTN|nr:Uncharacterised protein [Cutibacterium granulosum]